MKTPPQPHTKPSVLLNTEYQLARDTPSDINEHIELLNTLARQVDHVTEFGVRTGVSTRAFLAANVLLRAYDLYLNDRVTELMGIAKSAGMDVQYTQANVLDINIEETDILFIDTKHRYDQLIEELRLHASKVKKYIILHDTQSYGTLGEQFEGRGRDIGLLPAIIHYLIENPGVWEFKIHRTNNNGLTVLGRIAK